MVGIVIVGAGHASVQLAASLRQDGYTGDLTIVGDEPHLPYQRPPLSKTYMKDGAADRLILKAETFFEKNAISLLLGHRVVEIDRAAREIVLRSGERLGYVRLVLATGAQNMRPPLAGANHPAILELRTLAHAESIRARICSTNRHAIVVGGGFIGLEFAAMAAGQNISSTVLEAGSRLMARAVSPSISAAFLNYHRSIGNTVHLDAAVSEIIGGVDETIEAVRLQDGRTLPGEFVLLSAGVRPNVELAENAGLECRNGIVVDGHLTTSDPSICAIGDCASVPMVDGVHQRLESVQAATDQARHLSRHLTGSDVGPYHAVPWFWSDQGDLKLQIAGLPSSAETFEDRPADDQARTVLGYRGDRLVSVETINAAGDHMAARRLLGFDAAVTRQEIETTGFDLRQVLKKRMPS